MTTWTLIVVFTWLVPGPHSSLFLNEQPQIARSGMVVPGFQTRKACREAQEMLPKAGMSTCVPTQ